MRLLYIVLTVLLSVSISAVNAQGDQNSDSVPSEESSRKPFGLSIMGGFGLYYGGSIVGQGVNIQGTPPEKSLVESPGDIPIFEAELELDIREKIWISLNKRLGDGENSGEAAPGSVGDLFLGQSNSGTNGRIFRGFAAEETITVDIDINRLETGFSWEDISPRIGIGSLDPYLYYEFGEIVYEDMFKLLEFPTTGSETRHDLDSSGGGVGVKVSSKAFPIGGKTDFSLTLDASIGYGVYDYDGKQTVFNAPAPEVEFSAGDHAERAQYGFELEAIVKRQMMHLDLELFTSLGISNMPSIKQPTGQELEDGLANEIEFVNAKQFYLGARIRF